MYHAILLYVEALIMFEANKRVIFFTKESYYKAPSKDFFFESPPSKD
jgi:hypothetical protein